MQIPHLVLPNVYRVMPSRDISAKCSRRCRPKQHRPVPPLMLHMPETTNASSILFILQTKRTEQLVVHFVYYNYHRNKYNIDTGFSSTIEAGLISQNVYDYLTLTVHL